MTEQNSNAVADRSPRERALDAYQATGRRAASALGEAPLLALAGGIAAGALIAALLPRTDAETRAVGPTARRLRKTANEAARAARDTGTQRLEELGLTREKGEDTLRSLFQGLTDAVKASGQAAVDTTRNPR